MQFLGSLSWDFHRAFKIGLVFLWNKAPGPRGGGRGPGGRMLTGGHLQGEGVIRSVEDGPHHLLHPVLHDLLSHLRYALDLGVHRTDDRLFPLVQLVTHQSKAKWWTQKSINGFLEGGAMQWFRMQVLKATSIQIPALLGDVGRATRPPWGSFSLAVRQEEWSYLPHGVVARMNFDPYVNSLVLYLAHSAH